MQGIAEAKGKARTPGRLMMEMAENGHFFTQMPQPMHSCADTGATRMRYMY